MNSYFGSDKAQTLPDVEWIHEFTEAGFVIVTKDPHTHMNDLERDAYISSGARALILREAQESYEFYGARLCKHQEQIFNIANEPNPIVYVVHSRTLVPVVMPGMDASGS